MYWYAAGESLPPNVTGWQNPGQANSDYEYWIPSDRENDECLLGRTIRFIRRKQEAKCFNPVAFKQTAASFVKNCSCTEEDYEWYKAF